MATVVSTWLEFVAALESSETLIEVMADLDCNDSPPEATISVYGVGKTVNGNGHSLYNLSTGGVINGAIFYLNASITFNELNFYNCSRLEKEYFFRTVSNVYPTFNDCKIVGAAKRPLAGYCIYNRCAYTWRNLEGSYLHRYATFNWSWVHIDTLRTENTGGIEQTEIGTVYCSYIEGTWKNNFGGTPVNFYAAYWLQSSVINVNYDEGGITGGSQTPDISVGNLTRMPQLATGTYVKGATDAGMKDASYLAALGFNIIA